MANPSRCPLLPAELSSRREEVEGEEAEEVHQKSQVYSGWCV